MPLPIFRFRFFRQLLRKFFVVMGKNGF